VIAFCSSITEQFQSEDTRYFHFGLTSSDVIDTAHALIIKKSMLMIKNELTDLKKILHEKAFENRDLLCMGRSHGIYAEAMIFGQKFLSYEAELDRRLNDWNLLISELTGQLSGAVGNYTIISPEQEERTLQKLGLKVESISTQIIPRDRYASIISVGGLIASLFERMAIELRLLQHSDVDEVREGFSAGQKGSSTMPHKKNPISAENITGLCRILRSHVIPSLENCALWHERDISHSSAERIILPDHFGLIFYTTQRLKTLLKNLVINRNKIEARVISTEKIFSSLVLHRLVELNPQIPRDFLYELVQDCFFSSQDRPSLILTLEQSFEKHHLKHQCREWIDIENLRRHYAEQFSKILLRIV
jgi:adenylosuccinate lyase